MSTVRYPFFIGADGSKVAIQKIGIPVNKLTAGLADLVELAVFVRNVTDFSAFCASFTTSILYCLS